MTRFLALGALCLALAACASGQSAAPEEGWTLADVLGRASEDVQLPTELSPREQERRTEVERSNVAPPTPAAPAAPAAAAVSLTGGEIPAAFDGAPVPAFIDSVFAELLGLTVQMDPDVAAKRELVSLRTGEPLPPRELFNVAAAALSAYDVRTTVEGPRTVRFSTSNSPTLSGAVVLRGRSTPETPADLRPIFQYYPTTALSAANLFQMISSAPGVISQRVTLGQSPEGSALLIHGPAEYVAEAVYVLQALDRPRFAGMRGVTVTPVFMTASALATALQEMLRADGYDVGGAGSTAAVIVQPLADTGQVYVLTADEAVLDYVAARAAELDAPANVGVERRAFVYRVQNTSAENLQEIVAQVLEEGGAALTEAEPLAAPEAENAPAQGVAQRGRIVVDPARNALIFMGTPEEYAGLAPLLDELDEPPGEVLIEASIVEVTLTENENLGVEFLAEVDALGLEGDVGTLDGLGIGSSGLLFRAFDDSGAVRGLLNAFQRDNRISILSTPRVMARSGEEASIEVGTEVPVLTQQATSDSVGGGGIISSIDYRNTGVILNVRPTVRSGQRIDLELSQEVSEAQSNDTSNISSPLILNRNVQTNLSLRDGQTVVLGGLISDNRSETTTGVPVLQDVPLLGNAFRTQAANVTRTELLIFVTPYLIDTAERAALVTEFYQSEMSTWPDVAGEVTLWPTR